MSKASENYTNRYQTLGYLFQQLTLTSMKKKNILSLALLLMALIQVKGQLNFPVFHPQSDSLKAFLIQNPHELFYRGSQCFDDDANGTCYDYENKPFHWSLNSKESKGTYPNGDLYFKSSLVKGVKDGVYEEYINNILWFKAKYISNKLTSITFYSKTGSVIEESKLINGNGIISFYRPTGKLALKANYKGSKPYGNITAYYSNGNIMATGNYFILSPKNNWEEFNQNKKSIYKI